MQELSDKEDVGGKVHRDSWKGEWGEGREAGDTSGKTLLNIVIK